jgi:hypothetical protein
MERQHHGFPPPPPLNQYPELEDLKSWLLVQQKSSLYAISDWNEDGSWKCWNLGDFPPHLQNQAQILVKALRGATPLHRNTPDCRGWGSTGYSVKEGYKSLIAKSRLLNQTTLVEKHLELRWEKSFVTTTNFSAQNCKETSCKLNICLVD